MRSSHCRRLPSPAAARTFCRRSPGGCSPAGAGCERGRRGLPPRRDVPPTRDLGGRRPGRVPAGRALGKRDLGGRSSFDLPGAGTSSPSRPMMRPGRWPSAGRWAGLPGRSGFLVENFRRGGPGIGWAMAKGGERESDVLSYSGRGDSDRVREEDAVFSRYTRATPFAQRTSRPLAGMRGYPGSFRPQINIEARRGHHVLMVGEECASTSGKSRFLACASGFNVPNN